MAERNVLGGPRILWAGVAAVLLPLAILLGLQYWWLADLEHNSAIARKAALDNYLGAISKETSVRPSSSLFQFGASATSPLSGFQSSGVLPSMRKVSVTSRVFSSWLEMK